MRRLRPLLPRESTPSRPGTCSRVQKQHRAAVGHSCRAQIAQPPTQQPGASASCGKTRACRSVVPTIEISPRLIAPSESVAGLCIARPPAAAARWPQRARPRRPSTGAGSTWLSVLPHRAPCPAPSLPDVPDRAGPDPAAYRIRWASHGSIRGLGISPGQTQRAARSHHHRQGGAVRGATCRPGGAVADPERGIGAGAWWRSAGRPRQVPDHVMNRQPRDS